MSRLARWVLVVIGLSTVLAPAAVAAGETLTFGLPVRLLPADTMQPKDLDTLVGKFLAALRCRPNGCAGQPELKVSVALGSDYEILEWFSKGLLHLAVVPEVSTFLLRADDLRFREFALDAHPAPSRRFDGAAPIGELEPFARWIWCAARAGDRPEGRARRIERWDAAHRLVNRPEAGKDDACPEDSPGTASFELRVPSHLEGFPGVVDVVADWLVPRIGPWMCEGPAGRARARGFLEDAYWSTFLQHTRFTFGGHPPERSGTRTLWPEAEPLADRLVVARPVARRLRLAASSLNLSTSPQAGLPEPWRRRCPDDIKTFTAKASVGQRQVPGAFASALLTEPAFGTRTFSFSPWESIELLRLHKTRPTRVARPTTAGQEPGDESDRELALVLPGGGVKAAYQTVLVENLYRERLLVNAPGGLPKTPSDPVNVDYVIGTSGGALLGYFAARLAEPAAWNLDTRLWQWCVEKKCRPMRSTDIFGYIDMPRYLSAVAMLVILAIILYVRLPARPAEPAAAGWRMRLLLSVVPALLVIPLLVRYVNGDRAREHIPEAEGLVYAAAVLLAMFADQCLVVGGAAEAGARPVVRRRAGVALVVLGGVAMLVPALVTWLTWMQWMAEWPWLRATWTLRDLVFDRNVSIHKGAFLVCLGGGGLVAGIVTLVRRSAHYRQAVTGREFVSGVGVGLLQIALTSVGILGIIALWSYGQPALPDLAPEYWIALVVISAAAGLVLLSVRRLRTRARVALWAIAIILLVALWPNGQPSLLELTFEYWITLAAASILVALALLGIGGLRARPRGARWVAEGLDFLSSGHPNGGSTRRLVRLVRHATLAIVWWNIVLAPGVYGNALALEFLKNADALFRRDFAASLKVPLIVTANALEAEGARYFAFLPEPGDCLNLIRRSGYGATWLRRWPDSPAPPAPARPGKVKCGPEGPGDGTWKEDYLRDVVFASGSPYPVFPAHHVDDKIGRLVDGGYANNVPLDAAQGVGADQVLIVESSNPLGHPTIPGFLTPVLDAVRIQGDLVDNLPKLFTFLYERSQELDRISRRELLVVSLAPSRAETGWPTLVQFTGGVIERMGTVARDDWRERRRIGMVLSWGRPRSIHTTTVQVTHDGRFVRPR
jgi:predicted acylesterase/phospholipase RssA